MASHFVTWTKKGEAPSEPKKGPYCLRPLPDFLIHLLLESWSKMKSTIKMQVRAWMIDTK